MHTHDVEVGNELELSIAWLTTWNFITTKKETVECQSLTSIAQFYKSLISGHPLLSGHLRRSRRCPLNISFTVFRVIATCSIIKYCSTLITYIFFVSPQGSITVATGSGEVPMNGHRKQEESTSSGSASPAPLIDDSLIVDDDEGLPLISAVYSLAADGKSGETAFSGQSNLRISIC